MGDEEALKVAAANIASGQRHDFFLGRLETVLATAASDACRITLPGLLVVGSRNHHINHHRW